MSAASAERREFLQKRPDVISALIVISHIGFVFAPVYLAAALRPGGLVLALWFWFGLTAHGLTNLMHECAHYHLFRRRWMCDIVGRWVLGPLAFADFDNYRQLHWAHHQHLGEPEDPKYTYRTPISGWGLPLLVVRCVAGLEALSKLIYQNKERDRTTLRASRLWILRLAVFHAFMIASLSAVSWRFSPQTWLVPIQVAVAYLLVYVYGLVSLTLFVATLRAIAEHQAAGDVVKVAGQAVLRNLRCGALGRLVFGCYGFAEHATHHCQPAIPSYRLPEATVKLWAQEPWLKPEVGYVGILFRQIAHNRQDLLPDGNRNNRFPHDA